VACKNGEYGVMLTINKYKPSVQLFILVSILAGVACFAIFADITKVYPICFAASLSALTATVYYYFGEDIGDKHKLVNVIIFVSISVALIIGLIKGSLALSLGLVGALSIVRFRTPLKDPLQLTFLFIAIAIGIGAGAGYFVFTAGSTLIILLLVMLLSNLNNTRLFNQKGNSELVGKIEYTKQTNFALEDHIFPQCGIKVEITSIVDEGSTVSTMFKVRGVTIAALHNKMSKAVETYNFHNSDSPVSSWNMEFWCSQD
jgi:hypothetical protein